MPAIRYVCLSDTHFGADNSLLTHLDSGKRHADPMQKSLVLDQLIKCLRTLVDSGDGKPTLILNGDILELALATENQAAMAFERFLELAFPKEGEPLFQDRILYLPGNHDHHLWETAREAQYLNYLESEATNRKERLLESWHATNMFPPKNKSREVQSAFLNILAKRVGLEKVSFQVVYPNLGLLSEDAKRAVLITHGHFAEPIYQMVSELNTMLNPNRHSPEQVWDLETENFAWIDFFWSTLGRSGDAGKNVELIYDKLQKPDALKAIVKRLSAGIVQRFSSSWPASLKSWGLTFILDALIGYVAKPEARRKGDEPLTQAVRVCLAAYVTGPLRQQFKGERGSDPPPDVTLIFGHTHKPFERIESYDGYDEKVRVFNSGGWVIDDVDVRSQGGWAVVLIDKDLNVASLRGAGDTPESGVQVYEPEGAGDNPLSTTLREAIKPDQDPWRDFMYELERSIAIHRENLKQKIES